ncbi:MAG: septal ring lytic transglycosylase RlpA family protein [Candidatus Acidiferrales bacterium]
MSLRIGREEFPSHSSRSCSYDRVGRLTFVVLALASTLFFVAGCARHPRRTQTPAQTPIPPQVPPSQPAPPSPAPPGPAAVPGGYVEEGVASWYGYPFQGRRTSNGEIYDMHEFTAAHRTLPFNAVVRVTNLSNGKQTEVRINDRGPFVANRVIDLSQSAAQAIEMIGPGTAHVRLEVVSGPNPAVGYFGVQVGAFLVQDNAVRLKAQLESRYPPVSVVPFESPNRTFYRVRIGRLPNEDAARKLAEQLHESEQFTTFVVRLDE